MFTTFAKNMIIMQIITFIDSDINYARNYNTF